MKRGKRLQKPTGSANGRSVGTTNATSVWLVTSADLVAVLKLHMSQKDCISSEGGLQAIPAEELLILISFPGARTKPTVEPIHQSQ